MGIPLRVPQPLALLLKDYGLSGQSLAYAVGLDVRHLRRVLRGEILPTPDLAVRVAHYIGVPDDILFLRERGKYRIRSCQSCGTEFRPSGPHNTFCRTCRPRRTP